MVVVVGGEEVGRARVCVRLLTQKTSTFLHDRHIRSHIPCCTKNNFLCDSAPATDHECDVAAWEFSSTRVTASLCVSVCGVSCVLPAWGSSFTWMIVCGVGWGGREGE